MSNIYLPPTIVVPSSLVITAISRSKPMVVTAVVGNTSTQRDTYIVGMAVRLFVPRSYGMYQADNLVGTIVERNANNFTLSLDSTYFDAFVVPIGSVEVPASLSPAGSRNLEYNNYTVNNVPFKSYNNVGN